MSNSHDTLRREMLKWMAGAAVAGGGGVAVGLAHSAAEHRPSVTGRLVARLQDGAMSIEFDGQMHSRVLVRGGSVAQPLTDLAPSEYLLLAGAGAQMVAVRDFAMTGQTSQTVLTEHGVGVRHSLTGLAALGLEKTVGVTFYARYPGWAVMNVSYRNVGKTALEVRGWVNGAHRIKGGFSRAGGFWSFSGASHEDRRDWVQPVLAGFKQPNFMGMNASDYGGGTPVVDVWRRDVGLAVGHLERTPRLVALPIEANAGGVRVAVESTQVLALAAGESLSSLTSFVTVHRGDYFVTLDGYRRLMSERGLQAAPVPASSYEPIWCAWGYERDFTVERIEATLGKAKALGLEWAVLDDGWQTSEGDWKIDRKKFPHGEEDMKKFVATIKSHGMKSRLWIAPLAVDPGTDLLHDHTDMLLLNKDGAVQNVTWWNSFYLCPAYGKTIENAKALVRKILGEWGYDGLKVDGQHLNGVAPCFNPAHQHARPEESVEKLQDFFKAIYDTAMEINPQAVIEICPCGASYAAHNMPYMNQTPASDPLSSWQVRHKGKTVKALMGPSAPFAGDHIELSDQGDDFASSVGIGAVVSTKFTWPIDPKPKDSFLLTPDKERVWRKWIALYNERMLPKGHYHGELYDIGFDKPETHAIAKDGRMYYALYAARWAGPVELRGLEAGSYALRDYFNDRDLGTVSAANKRVSVSFERFLLLEAIPQS